MTKRNATRRHPRGKQTTKARTAAPISEPKARTPIVKIADDLATIVLAFPNTMNLGYTIAELDLETAVMLSLAIQEATKNAAQLREKARSRALDVIARRS